MYNQYLSLTNWNNYQATSEPQDPDIPEHTRTLLLGVRNGNAHLSVRNNQQALGNTQNFEAPDDTLGQDDFSTPSVPSGYQPQFLPTSQGYFEPASANHLSLPETNRQIASSSVQLPTHNPAPRSRTSKNPSSTRNTYNATLPLSRSQMTSKGKGRELPVLAPPMHPYMGAQGEGVWGRDVAGMQSTYSTRAVEGDDNDYNDYNGDDGGNDYNGDGDGDGDGGGGGDDNDDDDEGGQNPVNASVEQMYDEVDEIGNFGDFGSIAWWTTHHSHDGGLALVREFLLVVQEVLVMKGFPSFCRGSKKEEDLGDLLDRAREKFTKKYPDKRVLRFHPDKLRQMAVSHAGHSRDQYFNLILPVFTTHYGFIQGTWNQLQPPDRFHNLQLMYRLIGSRDLGIINKISAHIGLSQLSSAPQTPSPVLYSSPHIQVFTRIEFFNSPGYDRALTLMLPAAVALESQDGKMSYNYYTFVAVSVMRGAVGFGNSFGPNSHFEFRARVWSLPFKVIHRAAVKCLVGPDWDAHRRNLYASIRSTPPVVIGYNLPAELPF
ncbi:hypothetical protein PILCRDRAFT_16631 [Piloderma croceum F 1598]|uniref:Uncharacterized protein n=1 Tax=Piloderma croceum (strain F 1598) TaxID=765440 RepID=A0A0C3B3L8_PILCF|nr:hypothetical protein PILCRDRAFT_16631 [Piloderma croceum F 1598]